MNWHTPEAYCVRFDPALELRRSPKLYVQNNETSHFAINSLKEAYVGGKLQACARTREREMASSKDSLDVTSGFRGGERSNLERHLEYVLETYLLIK